MPDSPYVRRLAISLNRLGVSFEHEAVVVKVPTLVCPDGEVLMDSSLILQLIEAAHSQGRHLWPTDAQTLQQDFRVLGIARRQAEAPASSFIPKALTSRLRCAGRKLMREASPPVALTTRLSITANHREGT